jgi:putative PIN family toxin of toxin-antitoxin system
MRLIVLDTNVIVSAAIRPDGPPAKIVAGPVLSGLVHLVTSPRIAAEYREVVRRAKFHRYGFPPLWLEYLVEESMRLPDPASWPYVCPDPKDTPFLALAHAAGAWHVTENLTHFPEPIRHGVTVLSPTDYLAHLAGNSNQA